MDFFVDAFRWLTDPANYAMDAGSPLPIQARVGEHLWYTFISVLVAAALALPLGLYIGHTGRGRQFVIGFTGAMRALPTLGLLMALFLIVGATVPFTQAAFVASIIALVVLAIPPILAGGYAGVESVDPQTVDSGRAMGMTEMQILVRIEIPLSLPLIIAGIRAATVQVIATTVIASYISLGGLGTIISSGIGLNDNERILGGAILVTAVALVVDGILAIVQRLVTRRGSKQAQPTTKKGRRRAPMPSAVAAPPVDERKIHVHSKK